MAGWKATHTCCVVKPAQRSLQGTRVTACRVASHESSGDAAIHARHIGSRQQGSQFEGCSQCFARDIRTGEIFVEEEAGADLHFKGWSVHNNHNNHNNHDNHNNHNHSKHYDLAHWASQADCMRVVNRWHTEVAETMLDGMAWGPVECFRCTRGEFAFVVRADNPEPNEPQLTSCLHCALDSVWRNVPQTSYSFPMLHLARI